MNIDVCNVAETERWIEERVQQGIHRSWTRDDQGYLVTVSAKVNIDKGAFEVRLKVIAVPRDAGAPVGTHTISTLHTLGDILTVGDGMAGALQESFASLLDHPDTPDGDARETVAADEANPADTSDTDDDGELYLRDHHGIPVLKVTLGRTALNALNCL
ncbi:hypothetical protein ACFZAM_31555 [Streptomyces sp. NPDC008079]|uniref:hypothetical protein n=1 Tax=Streptomyces sp. NPDC008079 TaxID=3364806 RepID=UPI0036EF7CE0